MCIRDRSKPDDVEGRRESQVQFDLHSEIQNAKPSDFDPTLVIGASFVRKDMREVPSKTTVMEVDEDSGKILLEYAHGELKWVQPNVVQEALLERSEAIDANLHTFTKILDHRSGYQGRTEVQVQWDTDEVTWEPLAWIRKDDPITTAKYAQEKKLTEQRGWKWAKKIVRREKKFIRMLKINATQKKSDRKYKFGICLLYTSPSPRDLSTSRMPSSA